MGLFQRISDEQLLDEVYSDPVVIMGEFQEAFKRLPLDDKQFIRWNLLELQGIYMELGKWL